MWYKSYHINLYVKRCQYSICIRSMKTKTNTEISFSYWLTLFYSIPSLSPYRKTDRRTDRQTEERIYPGCAGRTLTGSSRYTHFAWAGGTCPRFAWAGGTVFLVELLCQFWFWWGIVFGCTYYYVLGVPYRYGVVLVFLVLAGNSFWCYVST